MCVCECVHVCGCVCVCAQRDTQVILHSGHTTHTHTHTHTHTYTHTHRQDLLLQPRSCPQSMGAYTPGSWPFREEEGGPRSQRCLWYRPSLHSAVSVYVCVNPLQEAVAVSFSGWRKEVRRHRRRRAGPVAGGAGRGRRPRRNGRPSARGIGFGRQMWRPGDRVCQKCCWPPLLSSPPAPLPHPPDTRAHGPRARIPLHTIVGVASCEQFWPARVFPWERLRPFFFFFIDACRSRALPCVVPVVAVVVARAGVQCAHCARSVLGSN